MNYSLPIPILANYSYDAVRIEDMRYDPAIPGYYAAVYGVSGGQPMPLIFRNSQSLCRITECSITDSEIAQTMATNPEITSVLQAALKVAMDRLYLLVRA